MPGVDNLGNNLRADVAARLAQRTGRRLTRLSVVQPTVGVGEAAQTVQQALTMVGFGVPRKPEPSHLPGKMDSCRK